MRKLKKLWRKGCYKICKSWKEAAGFPEKHWYDRFRWFVSSDGFLVVGGRDADTNEEFSKSTWKETSFFIHRHRALLTVVKTGGKEVRLHASGSFTVCGLIRASGKPDSSAVTVTGLNRAGDKDLESGVPEKGHLLSAVSAITSKTFLLALQLVLSLKARQGLLEDLLLRSGSTETIFLKLFPANSTRMIFQKDLQDLCR